MKDITTSLSSDKTSDKSFDEIIAEMYIKRELSSIEISDVLFEKTKIRITPRSIQRRLKPLGIMRDFSTAFNLAIRKGRKDYSHLKKAIKSNAMRKGINLKIRYKVLKRDKFKCVLCGRDANDTVLVVDHIVPVVKGGTNEVLNLRILCRECNHGKMLLEERHE